MALAKSLADTIVLLMRESAESASAKHCKVADILRELCEYGLAYNNGSLNEASLPSSLEAALKDSSAQRLNLIAGSLTELLAAQKAMQGKPIAALSELAPRMVVEVFWPLDSLWYRCSVEKKIETGPAKKQGAVVKYLCTNETEHVATSDVVCQLDEVPDNWRQALKKGMKLDALDDKNVPRKASKASANMPVEQEEGEQWRVASVVEVTDDGVKLHWNGWSKKHDFVLPLDSERIAAPVGIHSRRPAFSRGLGCPISQACLAELAKAISSE